MKKVVNKLPLAITTLLLMWLANRTTQIYIDTPGTFATTKVTTFQENLPYELLKNPFQFSLNSFPLYATAFIGAVVLLFISLKDTRKYRKDEEFGSGREGTEEDLKAFANKEFSQNIILAEQGLMSITNDYKDPVLQRNKNVMVVGGPGSWKTTAYNIPNVSQMNASYIVTDPKGEIRNMTGKMMERHGYKVKVLDLKTLTNTDQFNPFAYTKSEEILQDVITQIIAAGNADMQKNGEPFWDNAEQLLLSSLFMYLYYNYRGYKGKEGSGELPCLTDVADLLRNLERQDPDVKSPVELMFDDFEEYFGSDNPAVLNFQSFKNFSGETRSSVVSIPTARFRMFNLESVQNLTRRDTLELEKLGTEKTIIYVVLSDLNTTYNLFANLLFMLSFQVLEDVADYKHGGRLPLPVRMIMEEFPSIGRIPNILQAIAIFRGRGVGFEFTCQNFDQLKRIYKDTWEEIVGSCETVVYMSGATTKLTTTTMSERARKETIAIKDTSDSRGKSGSSSRSYRRMGRDVFMPDEVESLGRLYALVKISGDVPVVKLKKYNSKKHPRAKEWGKRPDDENWYHYTRYKDKLDELEHSIAESSNSELVVTTLDVA